MEKISSPQNDRFKALKLLLTSRGIKKSGEYLLMGRKTVPELLAQRPKEFKAIITPAAETMGLIVPAGIEIIELAKELFNELDTFGTHAPIALGSVPKLPCYDQTKAPEGLELLVPLGDPANLGALIRSAEAFGVSKVVLLEEATNPYHPKALRASSGATLRAPLFHGPAMKDLSSEVIALDMQGESIYEFKWPKNLRFLVGEEGPGLLKAPVTHKVSIPMQGQAESLNAMVATSIALAFMAGPSAKRFI